MKFSIGDLVIDKWDIQPRTSYGVKKVVGTLDGALLVVEWGSGYDGEIHHYEFLDEDETPGTKAWRSNLQRRQENDLFSTEEAVAELRRVEAIQDKLNTEFEAVRDQIKSKLDQASLLVQEASKLIKPSGKTFFDLKSECTGLYYALDEGGWSHSHMSC